LYQELLALRRTEPALRNQSRESFQATPVGDGAVALRRDAPAGGSLLLVASYRGPLNVDLARHPEVGAARWETALWSEAAEFGGAGDEPVLDGSVLALPGPGAVLLRSTR
jgi:maltooligosyltrehalose trehalohydrolase